MSDALTVVVVDDEAAAREELKYLLGRLPGVRVVGEATDGREALEVIARTRPDAAVLDVRMPPPNGLEVARRVRALSPGTRVVFATAYEAHAVDAFDLEATDYLLKPFSAERVARAVERLRAARPAAAPPRLTVERRRATWRVDPQDVLWIGTDAGVVTVVATDGTRYGSAETLQALAATLEPWGFYRCHREAIVPLARVRALMQAASGTGRVVLDDPAATELPVARNRVRGLRERLAVQPRRA